MFSSTMLNHFHIVFFASDWEEAYIQNFFIRCRAFSIRNLMGNISLFIHTILTASQFYCILLA